MNPEHKLERPQIVVRIPFLYSLYYISSKTCFPFSHFSFSEQDESGKNLSEC